MKKYYILSLLSILLPFTALSHEVKQANTLEILLHLEPQDSPIAREVSNLYFNVSDLEDKFSFPDCACKVSIASSGNVLLDRELTAADEAPDWGVNVSRVEFVFPSLGIYQVSIEGRSRANLYQAFKLVYDVRIERESANQAVDLGQAVVEEGSDFSLTYFYVIGGAVLVSGIIAYEIFNPKRKKK